MLVIIKRCVSRSTLVFGRKTNDIYDKRIYPITGKHVNKKTPGGWEEFPKIAEELNPFRVAPTGYEDSNGKYHHVPELVPEFVVPDLTDFDLKPYVSYRVKELNQSEFTAAHLFEACLANDVRQDFNAGKLKDEIKKLSTKSKVE